MLWVAVTMFFFCFLRSGEVTVRRDSGFDPARHLAFGDIRVDSNQDPRHVAVRIKASKTDPYWQGVTVYLDHAPSEQCPVAAVQVHRLASFRIGAATTAAQKGI